MDSTLFTIFVFLAVGAGFAAMPLVVSFLVGYNRRSVQPPKELQQPAAPDEIPWMTPADFERLQGEPIESGMPSVGPWRKIGFEYVIYVILFLVFDMIFITIFYSLGAWLEMPGLVTALICAGVFMGLAAVFYALAPRKYLRL